MKNELKIDGDNYFSADYVDKNYVSNKEFKMLKRNVGKRKDYGFEPFPTVIEARLHRTLKKFLIEEIDCVSETWAINQEKVCVVDPANICMVVSKSDRAKLVLRRYMNSEMEKEQKYPPLNYKMEKDSMKSKYTTEYLLYIMNFFAQFIHANYDFEESVIIKVSKDYPITLYNKDFEIILAPRVSD